MLRKLLGLDKVTDKDPLTNLHTVSRWMNDMPSGDIYVALGSVIESLIRFNQTQSALTKDRLQVLMHLDEKTRDIHESLCEQYLKNPRMSKAIETRMWSSINAFLWEITRGYHALLMDYVNDPGASKIQSLIPQVTARGIRGFADMFRWKYIRYEKPDERLWLRMHNLFRISEFDSFHNKDMVVYTGKVNSSCTNEYIKALLLSAIADGGTHLPKQIAMVDGWLDRWPTYTRMEDTYDKDRHHFFVDTAQGRGVRSIQNPDAFKGIQTIRYLDTHPLLIHMAATEQKIQGGTSPVMLGLGEEFRLPDGYEVMGRTVACWSYITGRNRRRSERISCDSNLESVLDMDGVHQMLSMHGGVQNHRNPSDRVLTYEEMLDIKIYGFVTERTKAGLIASIQQPKYCVETWQLVDKSTNGAGVLAQETKPIKTGALIAIRASKQEEWQPGVVRRIARQRDSVSIILGLELIPHDSSAVLLSDKGSIDHHDIAIADVADYKSDGGSDIKALKITDIDADVNHIILPSISYANGRRYAMRDGNNEHWVTLGSVVDKGDGWVKTIYSSVVAQSADVHNKYESITVVGSGNNLVGELDV